MSSSHRDRLGRRPPIVLTAALTGPSYSAKIYPNIPLSPEQVIVDAQSVFAEGARVIHVHARNPKTGLQFADLSYYRTVKAGIRESLGDVPLIFPSSRKGEVEFQIETKIRELERDARPGADLLEQRVRAELVRAIGVEAVPDRITTFTPPELLISGNISEEDYAAAISSYSDLTRKAWKDPTVMGAYYRALTKRARFLAVAEELEITTWKAFDVIEGIAGSAALTLPEQVSFVLLFGFSAHLAIDKAVYAAAMERIHRIEKRAGITAHVTVGAAIPPALANPGPARPRGSALPSGKHDYREVIEWVAEDPEVASFRVGLEDTPELFGGKPSNAGLVRHAREVFENLGVRIELSVPAARWRIGLKHGPSEGGPCPASLGGISTANL